MTKHKEGVFEPMKIDLLTPLVNSYLSKSDTIDKKASLEAAILSVNENIVALQHMKETMKENSEKISAANYLSICFSLSENTKAINQTDCCLRNPTQI